MRGELESTTAPEFRRELDRALVGGAGCVVVDLAEITFIDSLGLAALIDGARQIESTVGERCFAVTAARSGVARLLTLTAVDRMIPTYATAAQALDELSPGTRPSGDGQP